MAEGGKLRGHDRVQDELLMRISEHISITNLQQLAVQHLGLTIVEYDNAIHERVGAIDKISKVLEAWRNKQSAIHKGNYTLEDLLGSMLEWQQGGFIEAKVWDTLEGIVGGDVIEAARRRSGKRPAATGRSDERPAATGRPGKHPAATGRPDEHSAATGRPGKRPRTTENSEELSEEDKLIQQWTKDSLKQSLNKFLSVDWLPRHKAQTFSLLDYYLEVEYEEVKETPRKPKVVEIKDIYRFIQNAGELGRSVNYLILGPAGIGKSSCLSSVALNWTLQNKDQLKQFTFLFLIRLREVNENCPLENLIINNHQQLSDNKVSPEQIWSILHNYKTLIMLDGYDEYPPGTNDAIDKAIEHTVGKCVLLLTSRPEAIENIEHTAHSQATENRPNIKTFMCGLITIKGFSVDTIKEYCDKYFEDPQISEAMIEQAKEVKIDDLLHIPILLLMVCTIYDEHEHLPESSTKVFHEVYELMISRSMERLPEAERLSKEQLDHARYLLGKLSLQALKEKKQYINEAILTADIIKMGVVSPVGPDRTVKKGEKFLGFHHKSVMEFSGSNFLSKEVKRKTPEETLEVLKEWFPSRFELNEHRQVIYFTCELLEDAPEQRQVLIEYVWQEMEYVDILPASAHHTESGHYYRHTAPLPINILSKRYLFDQMKQTVEWKVPTGTTVPDQLKECKVTIEDPDESVGDNLLSVCGRISEYQEITFLRVEGDVEDVSVVSTLHALRELDLSHNSQLTSLPALPHSLQVLQVWHTGVEDVSAVSTLHALRELDLSYNRRLTSLPALSPSLEQLDVSYTGVEDVSAVSTLHALRELHLLNNPRLTSLPALPPSLQVLHVSRTGVEGVSEVERSVRNSTLRDLWLLGMSEEAVDRVVESAVTHRPHQELWLKLGGEELSPEFKDRLSRRCAGTQITLGWSY